MDEAKENVSSPKGTTEAGSNAGQANLFALTISADTGEIVKIERVEG
jgi:hypothetical protein